MKYNLSSFVVGILFAIGLGIAGMTQPQKVIAFLDFFDHWDPSLLFVMLGAISTHFVLYRLIRRRALPVFTLHWDIPEAGEVNRNLIFGSLIFGVGWGLAGFCPGPALVSLVTLSWQSFVFVGAMIAGMCIHFLGGRYSFWEK